MLASRRCQCVHPYHKGLRCRNRVYMHRFCGPCQSGGAIEMSDPLPERGVTHRCPTCGAWWARFGPEAWSTSSAGCGRCGEMNGKQLAGFLVPLAAPLPERGEEPPISPHRQEFYAAMFSLAERYDIDHDHDFIAATIAAPSWAGDEFRARDAELARLREENERLRESAALSDDVARQAEVCITKLRGENAKMTARWNATVDFMERNLSDALFCEGCGVLMLQGEDGYEALGSEDDPDDTADYCDLCCEMARKELEER